MMNAASVEADYLYPHASSAILDNVPLSQLSGTHQVPNSATTFEANSGTMAHTIQERDADIPDGGYGWVVVGACAMLTFWFVGTTYSWGVIQGRLVQEGLSPPSTLSFVGALTVSWISLLAIVNAKLISFLGPQRCALVGVSLLGLGEVLGGFCTHSVGGLFATIGTIMGIGTRFTLHLPSALPYAYTWYSLCFMTVSTVPAQYFLRRRGLANGIVYAGGGIGGAVISLTLEKLLETLGPAWTFRILGILTLATGLPAAYLIRERFPIDKKRLVEWPLLKSLKFNLLFIAGMVATFSLFVPPFFLPLYCRSIGLSSAIGAGMVATFNFSSALGRITFGLASDRLGPLNSLFLSLFLSALSMLVLWSLSSSLAPLIVFAVINGTANGGFFALIPTVVISIVGSDLIAVAMGMIVTGWAGGYLMGGPIAAYLLQAFGGAEQGISAYRPAMYYAGSTAMSAAILVAFVRLRVNSKLIKRA